MAVINKTTENISFSYNINDASTVCREVYNDFDPTNNPHNIISAETQRRIDIAIYCVVMPVLLLLGMVTNTFSCAVFSRLGVKRSFNLCLMLLSVSDLLFLITKTAIRLSRTVLIIMYGKQGASQWINTVITYHLMRKPMVFLFFSNFLTTLASVERCVSVVSPLKAHSVFTTGKVSVAIVCAFLLDLLSFVVIGFKYRVLCVVDGITGELVWSLAPSKVWLENTIAFNTLDNFVLVFGFPILSLLVVVMSSGIIIYKLRVAAKWRNNTSSAGKDGPGGTGVDKSEAQLYKMLVAVSVVHVSCTLPSIVKDVCKFFFFPDYHTTGIYSNFFEASIALKDATTSINCAVNFFVYYNLGSHFRNTFKEMVGWKIEEKTAQIVSSESTTITTTG